MPVITRAIVVSGSVVLLVIRLTVGLVCLWAGLEQASSLNAFRQSISNYRLMPTQLTTPAATAVVAAELTSAVLLLTGLATSIGAFAAVVLFTAFTAALVLNLTRGNHVACHCFGYSETERVSKITAGRAALLLMLSALTYGLFIQRISNAPWDAILPSFTLAAAFAMALRLVSLIPQTWRYMTTAPVISPTQGHRVSFRNTPPDSTLRWWHDRDRTTPNTDHSAGSENHD